MERISRRFVLWLLAITGGGLAFRVLFAWFGRRTQHLGFTDSGWYTLQGVLLAHGSGFVDPFRLVFGFTRVPSAFHAPLFSMYFGVVNLFGFDLPIEFRFATCLLGAGTVLVIGLLGRRLAGDRAGLIAAGIAALYPNLWINDTAVVSEALTTLLTTITLILCYRFWRRPGWVSAALLGGSVGLAVLNRAEVLLLYPLVVLPLALVLRALPLRRRLGLVAISVVAGVAFFAPWAAYNVARFHQPSPPYIANGAGTVVMLGNCDSTYRGRYLGYWRPACGIRRAVPGDESDVEAVHRKRGTDYIKAHLTSQPRVMAARVGRLWQVYRPIQSIGFDKFFERRGLWPSRLALVAYYPLLVGAVAGLVVLHRQRVTIIPPIGIAIATTATAAITFGITRYRAPVDAALPAFAAIAIEALLTRRRKASGTAASPPDSSPSSAAPA